MGPAREKFRPLLGHVARPRKGIPQLLPATRANHMLAQFPSGGFMTAPLDPSMAQIIPLLPLRDPDTMTPQSALDALRALAASRAAVPPQEFASADDIQVNCPVAPLASRLYRVSPERSPTVVFFH